MDEDYFIREEAIKWARTLREAYEGKTIPRRKIEEGFYYKGKNIKVIGPQGIFKPQSMNLPISVTSSPSRPYEDIVSEDGEVISYCYRGTDVNHRDNAGIREVFKLKLPLLFFYGIETGEYDIDIVYICGDNPAKLKFEMKYLPMESFTYNDVDWKLPNIIIKEDKNLYTYTHSERKVRRKQASFRLSVMHAYRDRCCICRLKKKDLLEASHIIPYSQNGGQKVTNGLSLCLLHHGAYDSNLLSITPEYKIKVDARTLREKDGPMLEHGIKNIHNTCIILPKSEMNHPSREALDRRHSVFLQR